MPIIKDPVHNHKEGRFGVVYARNVLAVYDKTENNDLRWLPAGWDIDGSLVPLTIPFLWCGITIHFKLEVTNLNLEGEQGPVAGDESVKVSLRENEYLTRDAKFLEEPVDGIIIYPLD